MIRPGPEAIAPGGAPGGVVFRAYNGRTEALIGADAVTALPAEPSAELIEAVEAVDAGDPVVLVAYDGDTGRRFTPEQLADAGLISGDRL